MPLTKVPALYTRCAAPRRYLYSVQVLYRNFHSASGPWRFVVLRFTYKYRVIYQLPKLETDPFMANFIVLYLWNVELR